MNSDIIALTQKIDYLSKRLSREAGENKSIKILRVLQKGTGRPPKDGDQVSILYIGKLTDGTVFDSSEFHNNQPFTFTVGGGGVIKGWDLAVRKMRLNKSMIVEIPSKLGYGIKGAGNGKIPPNSNLIFKMTMTNIKRS